MGEKAVTVLLVVKTTGVMMKTMKTRMKMTLPGAKTTIEKRTCPSHLLRSKGQSTLMKVGCT